MTQDEIISMMKEAGFYFGKDDEFMPEWERFAALVAAHERENSAKMQGDCTLAAVLAEREACAKACETLETHGYPNNRELKCAAAIRARGEK